MPFEAAPEDVDFELLATYLKALSHPRRLELLWRLRHPANPNEIQLRPHRRDDMSPERAMSRQTVEEHLSRLAEVGVVTRVTRPEGGGDVWATDVPHVFALVEEMRKLSTIPPVAIADPDETMASASERQEGWPKGAKLVLLSGPWEGRAFPLEGKGPWTIGRSRSRHVALTYDPFVSAEHVSLRRAEGDTYHLDVGTETKNPTLVNYGAVTPGTSRALQHGDVIKLGHSLLLLRAR